MAKNKTVETQASVADYLAGIADAQKRADTASFIEHLTTQTGLEPKMWGASIVGFGTYHYRYESGREGDAPIIGLSARAASISLYLPNFEGREALLAQLGKHKTGKGCVYVQKIADIDLSVFSTLVQQAMDYRVQQ